MAAILALAAALSYGLSDFLGGAASRRTRPLAVLAISSPAGAAVTVLAASVGRALGVDGGGFGGPAGVGWAAAAGAVGTAGLMVFYAGFAAAPMSVVAPVSALISTLVPLGAAIAQGERLTVSVAVGAALCLAAVVLVSGPVAGQESARRLTDRLRGAGYGVAAGTMFGLFFLFFKNAGSSALLWPIVVVRLVGVVVVVGVVAVTRTAPPWRSGQRHLSAMALLSGIADASANICYVLATRAGLFGLVVVITSLYPGVTVVLARLVLGERMHPLQRAGLLLATIGVLLVTV